MYYLGLLDYALSYVCSLPLHLTSLRLVSYPMGKVLIALVEDANGANSEG